ARQRKTSSARQFLVSQVSVCASKNGRDRIATDAFAQANGGACPDGAAYDRQCRGYKSLPNVLRDAHGFCRIVEAGGGTSSPSFRIVSAGFFAARARESLYWKPTVNRELRRECARIPAMHAVPAAGKILGSFSRNGYGKDSRRWQSRSASCRADGRDQ